MKEIKDNLDIFTYIDPKFDCSQIDEIRLGLKDGLDISIYKEDKL